MKHSVGIDIGGTKCAVILGASNDQEGITIVDKIAFPTEVEKGPQYTIDRICHEIEAISRKNGIPNEMIHSFGISCGGPLDSKRGIIKSPPNLIGWDNIPITDILSKKFGRRVWLQNDANACALAEWRFGAGKGCSNMIFLTFGTGLGAGLILDGRLYSGTNDMAGEVGHLRLSENGPVGYGKAGSFEGFCSGGGIAQLARTKVLEKLQMGVKVSFCKEVNQLNEITAKTVAEAAEAGDELAREIYSISGSYLGKGLALLIDILNPEVIVIGSIFTRNTNLLLPSTLEVLKRESLRYSNEVCKIVPAVLDEQIGDFAALAVALQE